MSKYCMVNFTVTTKNATEEVENHHFEGVKGHFEDIYVHSFN